MAAKSGSIEAKVRMGEIYLRGTPTLPKNPEKAYLLFHESATKKHPDGMYNLAMLYQ
jgi:TPR repeat protein